MSYEELVGEIRNLFMKADVSDIKEHIAYQFNIRGASSLMNIMTGMSFSLRPPTPC